MKQRINIKTIGAFLMALLLVFTFLSKTIYQYSLPTVSADSPVKGRLHKVENVKGTAGWNAKGELYAGAAGFVEELLVEEGQSVVKGQPLMRLSFSDTEVAAAREKEYEIQQVDSELAAAEEACGKLKTLHEAGAISESEYEKEDRNRKNLYAKRDKLLQDLADVKNEAELTVSAPEDCIVTDLLVQKGQRVNQGEKVGNYGTSLAFGIECSIPLENDFIQKGDSCKVGNSSLEFIGTVLNVSTEADKKKVRIQIPEEEQKSGVDDSSEVDESSGVNDGLVFEEELNTGASLGSDIIKDGDSFDVVFEKESAEARILVPNGALNRDNNGYFLYQIKQRKGLLGKEFYVAKLRVYIGDNDAEYTVVTKGITFFEPVVVQCDKELTEGDTVVLENEGDFFKD
ncbi:MAG: transporter [Bacillota bacterium]|nr:transporter [Bacillota bacterium]